MSTIFIGIDPGLDGCVCVIDPNKGVTFHDTPTVQPGKRRRYDYDGMLAILRCYSPMIVGGQRVNAPCFVALEEVHAMPGQGVTSMFSMGMGLAAWEMGLTASGIPFQNVTPQRWQGTMLAGTAPAKTPKGRKARAYRVAAKLWPAFAAQLKGPKGGILDGRSDALLIASWAQRQGSGIIQLHDHAQPASKAG